jgi:hypothetical protein
MYQAPAFGLLEPTSSATLTVLPEIIDLGLPSEVGQGNRFHRQAGAETNSAANSRTALSQASVSRPTTATPPAPSLVPAQRVLRLVAVYLNFRFMALTSSSLKPTGPTSFPSGSARICKSRCVLTSPRPTAASRPSGPNKKPTAAQFSQSWPLLLATAPVKSADKTPTAASRRTKEREDMTASYRVASGCLLKYRD